MSSENNERMALRGPAGAKGDRGAAGPAMTTGARRALIAMFATSLVIGGADALWSTHLNQVQQAQQRAAQHQAAEQQAEQRRQGAAVEAKLCRTLLPLVPLARLQAPAGNPVTNPSRGYEQELSRTLRPLANLAPDLGCR